MAVLWGPTRARQSHGCFGLMVQRDVMCAFLQREVQLALASK